jgi:hypothetical protein
MLMPVMAMAEAGAHTAPSHSLTLTTSTISVRASPEKARGGSTWGAPLTRAHLPTSRGLITQLSEVHSLRSNPTWRRGCTWGAGNTVKSRTGRLDTIFSRQTPTLLLQ